MALFSVLEYSKIAQQACYFHINWLSCSAQLSGALWVGMVVLLFMIFSCLVLSGLFIWKSFCAKERISNKNILVSIIIFIFLSFLVVPFGSGDITFYYHSGKTVQAGINPYTQAWLWENPFVPPVVNKEYKHGFAYGPITAHVFSAVYKLSNGNIVIFIILWKMLMILFFSLCGLLFFKFLDFSKGSAEENHFWLLWFLQPAFLFEWIAIGHFDSIWLAFILLSLVLVKRKTWWLVLPCLVVGIWIKFIPIFFLPWFVLKWWQEVNWQNWKKMLGGQAIGVAISIAITMLSWAKLWQGFTVFETLARISKWAAMSTFSLIYYSLAPLFRSAIGADFHWYLTRFVQFGLIALILYLMYPFLKKAVMVILRKDIFSESEFLSALFVSMLVYVIFWQKAVWPWYIIWLLPLGIVAYVKSENNYIKKITAWITLSPLFFYFIWGFYYQITSGGDATSKLWFYYYFVISIFVYPMYNLFKWRKTGYGINKLDVVKSNIL